MKKIDLLSPHTSKRVTKSILREAEAVSEQMVKTIESHVAPVRRSVLQRYPTLFSLLIMFGVATTYYAFERILGQYKVLNDYPWLILCLGLSVLALTGRLYKKLS